MLHKFGANFRQTGSGITMRFYDVQACSGRRCIFPVQWCSEVGCFSWCVLISNVECRTSNVVPNLTDVPADSEKASSPFFIISVHRPFISTFIRQHHILTKKRKEILPRSHLRGSVSDSFLGHSRPTDRLLSSYCRRPSVSDAVNCTWRSRSV